MCSSVRRRDEKAAVTPPARCSGLDGCQPRVHWLHTRQKYVLSSRRRKTELAVPRMAQFKMRVTLFIERRNLGFQVGSWCLRKGSDFTVLAWLSGKAHRTYKLHNERF